MTKSMTGYASANGANALVSWSWEIRSVNARGMDARLRVPDWLDGLENKLKSEIKKSVARGNVNLTLKVSRNDTGQGVAPDSAALAQILDSIRQIESAAVHDHGIQLAQTTAADILSMRPVADAPMPDASKSELTEVLLQDFQDLLGAFDDMRRTEGSALEDILSNQLAQIAELTKQAQLIAEKRKDETAGLLKRNLANILENSDGADPDRVAQELAILALKSDVTEEIDRLETHVSSARELLAGNGPVGRKLDFLTQEFNREANTLCSKAQSKELTRTGLDLKAVIEQMREQVQNVE